MTQGTALKFACAAILVAALCALPYRDGGEPQAQVARPVTGESVETGESGNATAFIPPGRDPEEARLRMLEEDLAILETVVAHLEQRWAVLEAELNRRPQTSPAPAQPAPRDAVRGESVTRPAANRSSRDPLNVGRRTPFIRSIERGPDGQMIINYGEAETGTRVRETEIQGD